MDTIKIAVIGLGYVGFLWPDSSRQSTKQLALI